MNKCQEIKQKLEDAKRKLSSHQLDPLHMNKGVAKGAYEMMGSNLRAEVAYWEARLKNCLED